MGIHKPTREEVAAVTEANHAYYGNERLARAYAQRTANMPVDPMLWEAIQLTRDLSGMSGPLHGVDLGCGGGLYAATMKAAGMRVTAVDKFPDLLSFAREEWGLVTVETEMDHPPQGVNSVDLLWCRAVFVHLDEASVNRVISGWSAHMRPNSVAYFRYKVDPERSHEIRGGGHSQEGHRRGFIFHNPTRINGILKRKGFKIYREQSSPDDSEPGVMTQNTIAVKRAT